MIIDKKYLELVDFFIAMVPDFPKWKTDLSITAPALDRAIRDMNMIEFEKEMIKIISTVKDERMVDILTRALNTITGKNIKISINEIGMPAVSVPIKMES